MKPCNVRNVKHQANTHTHSLTYQTFQVRNSFVVKEKNKPPILPAISYFYSTTTAIIILTKIFIYCIYNKLKD